jgi:salicylate hydroxylase
MYSYTTSADFYRLTKLISQVDSALKWKLLHFDELDRWTKGPIVLIGDASHPTLPYQGQGAAMAVEDGVILASLLGNMQRLPAPSNCQEQSARLTGLFQLFENLRKQRTKTNVAGAVGTRHYYHLSDGEEQRKRDEELAGLAALHWEGPCSFNWGDARYQKNLLGFDVLADAEKAFQGWAKQI